LLLLSVQKFDRQENRPPHDFETVLRHFVHGVGVTVVEFTHGIESHVHTAILGVNHIDRRNTNLYE